MHTLKKSFVEWSLRAAALGLRLAHNVQVYGRENIPPAPAIFCSNHFSSVDPMIALMLMPSPTHMIISAAMEWPIWRNFLLFCEHIDATAAARGNVVSQAVEYLRRGENIYIFPEGAMNDQRGLLEFRSGLARICLQHACPVVPIGLAAPASALIEFSTGGGGDETIHRVLKVGGPYVVQIGAALRIPAAGVGATAGERAAEITQTLRRRIQELTDEARSHL
ncbi:MAG TPA: lysophospholipid acyltransferase family protein [Pseudomonadota bacterium]|nr:lysophospholipid acyltransferase family protein [Pseudomonadota bacterium]